MKNWNMKKIVIMLLSIMVLSYGIGVIILYTSPKSIFKGETGRFSIDEEKTASAAGISEINVTTASTDINVVVSDTNEVRAHFYGNVTTSSYYETPQLDFNLNGSTLNINVKNRTNMTFGFFMSSLKVDITVPKSYNKSIKLASSSGEINIQNVNVESLSCSTSSGSTNIENVSADEFNHSSSSGDLKATGITTKQTKTTSSSGSRTLKKFTGGLSGSSSSGSIKVQYLTFSNDIKLNASSGSIEITLPNNSEFGLEVNTSSGGIKCAFPISIKDSGRHRLSGTIGNGTNNISLNTSSGDIEINK